MYIPPFASAAWLQKTREKASAKTARIPARRRFAPLCSQKYGAIIPDVLYASRSVSRARITENKFTLKPVFPTGKKVVIFAHILKSG